MDFVDHQQLVYLNQPNDKIANEVDAKHEGLLKALEVMLGARVVQSPQKLKNGPNTQRTESLPSVSCDRSLQLLGSKKVFFFRVREVRGSDRLNMRF